MEWWRTGVMKQGNRGEEGQQWRRIRRKTGCNHPFNDHPTVHESTLLTLQHSSSLLGTKSAEVISAGCELVREQNPGLPARGLAERTSHVGIQFLANRPIRISRRLEVLAPSAPVALALCKIPE